VTEPSEPRADELVLRPIGYARTPHAEKADAPRQPAAALGIAGTLELLPAYRDGLRDLEGFDRILVIFGFDRAPATTSLTVQPPRSEARRGVFATRSPHRPNRLGLSVLRLAAIEGATVHVLDVDLLDRTPVYDIKPYLAYTDAFPDARAGWLETRPRESPSPDPAHAPADPRARYAVRVADGAREALAFVAAETPLDLEKRATESLSLGPEPHAYRRIRTEGSASVLAVKEWRVVFTTTGPRELTIVRVRSGYSARDLARETPALEVHRRFVARFGA